MVIFSTNTVHSILYLVLVFCNATAMLLLLNLDYIAMVYVVVYVGAIAILFIFVVMMLNIKLLEIKENFWVYTPLAGLIGLMLLLNFIYLFKSNSVDFVLSELTTNGEFGLNKEALSNFAYNNIGYVDWLSAVLTYENIQAIGLVLYSYYGFAFVLSSLLLLVAMMGSIILTLKESVTTKRQDVFKQTQNNFVKTINLR
jgi:NADH-ubiquinone oxidoreductase chain 6